jgi:hypothetical protein
MVFTPSMVYMVLSKRLELLERLFCLSDEVWLGNVNIGGMKPLPC